MTVRTDLHTHFAGVLTADELIDLGLAHGSSLDVRTAKKLDIVAASYTGAPLPLSALTASQMTKLKAGLELPPDKKSLFEDLDQVYFNRAFITKDADIFEPLLMKIAQSYKEQGISYAELSYAGVLEDDRLIKILHGCAPRIEQETGVTLRFLGALWRHSTPEWNADHIDKLKSLAKSPYIVGLDVMGHETTPIREMKGCLEEIIRHAVKHIPGFVVRIHAGETSYHSSDPQKLDEHTFNNAYEAVQIADSARRDAHGALIGPHGSSLQIRLGHGRYGLHMETLKLMAKTGAQSELCLTSNMLLNSADDYEGPFNHCTDNHVPFSLGSDGYGIYGTSLPQEFNLAVKAGMRSDAQALLTETEGAVIAFDQKRFAKKMAAWKKFETACAEKGVDPFTAVTDVIYGTGDGKQRWTPNAVPARQARLQAQGDALLSEVEKLGINTNMDDINRLLQTREVYIFSGASRASWDRIPEDQKEKVVNTMRELIDRMEGRKDVVVTGGADYGFDAVIHRLVKERNQKLPPDTQISSIGALTLEAGLDEIKPATLSHAMVLQHGAVPAKNWMDQPSPLIDVAERVNGKIITAGGGQVIRDMIVVAERLGLIDEGRFLLFDGVYGASGDRAKDFPQAKFSDGASLLKLLAANDNKPASSKKRAPHPKP